MFSRLFGTSCIDQGQTFTLEQEGEALDRLEERDNKLSKKSDAQITRDVLDELFWDPAVTIANPTVSTTDQRVTLMGMTATYGEKLEAEEAAYRVSGGAMSITTSLSIRAHSVGVATSTLRPMSGPRSSSTTRFPMTVSL